MAIWVEEISQEHAVVHVQGQLDRTTAMLLDRSVQHAAAKGLTQLVIDMHEVDSIDSRWLSMLVFSLKELRQQQGMLVLANVEPKLKTALELSRLDQIFAIYEDAPAALRSFAPLSKAERAERAQVNHGASASTLTANPLLKRRSQLG